MSNHSESANRYPGLRRAFNLLNRYFMVPAFRLGLGWLIGSPPGGYIMVLATTGRRSGRRSYVPVNYAMLEGNVYCLSGWGERAQWYRNLLADPRVELLLPLGRVRGVAETVRDPQESLAAARAVLISAGFAAAFAGVNPRTAADADLERATALYPVVRVRATGVLPGAADPGGWLWVLPPLALLWWVMTRRRR